MSAKELLVEMAIIIPLTFIVAAVVTYLYALIAHGSGVVDWEASFDLALIIGIVLPLAGIRARRAA
jgi:hypothetical protein